MTMTTITSSMTTTTTPLPPPVNQVSNIRQSRTGVHITRYSGIQVAGINVVSSENGQT